jgi:hypothetical protein
MHLHYLTLDLKCQVREIVHIINFLVGASQECCAKTFGKRTHSCQQPSSLAPLTKKFTRPQQDKPHVSQHIQQGGLTDSILVVEYVYSKARI